MDCRESPEFAGETPALRRTFGILSQALSPSASVLLSVIFQHLFAEVPVHWPSGGQGRPPHPGPGKGSLVPGGAGVPARGLRELSATRSLADP